MESVNTYSLEKVFVNMQAFGNKNFMCFSHSIDDFQKVRASPKWRKYRIARVDLRSNGNPISLQSKIMSKAKTRTTTHPAGPDDIDIEKYQMELAEVRLNVDFKLKRNDAIVFQKGVLAECLRGKLYKIITEAIASESLSLAAFGIQVESADVHVDKRDQPY